MPDKGKNNQLFNKDRMISNIVHLLKLRDRRIGELEEYAGLSTGYIARTKNAADTKPGIEYIMKMADFLGVTIDALLNADLTKITLADQYWLDFIKKLTEATRNNIVNWENIAGGFQLKMENKAILELKDRKVSNRPYSNTVTVVREVFLQNAGKRQLLCSSGKKDAVGNAVDELHTEVDKNAGRPKIDKLTKDMLDEFLVKLRKCSDTK